MKRTLWAVVSSGCEGETTSGLVQAGDAFGDGLVDFIVAEKGVVVADHQEFGGQTSDG